MTSAEITLAYLKLYRSGLRAVQFSKPARFRLRDQLRAAFREPGATFNADRVRRTVWFFNAAAQTSGLEHKILKNLLRVAGERAVQPSWGRLSRAGAVPRSGSMKGREYEQYDLTIRMLNDTMGLCLR